jgi:hypothetical protein
MARMHNDQFDKALAKKRLVHDRIPHHLAVLPGCVASSGSDPLPKLPVSSNIAQHGRVDSAKSSASRAVCAAPHLERLFLSRRPPVR